MITIHTHVTNPLYFLIIKLYKFILYLGLKDTLRVIVIFPMKVVSKHFPYIYTIHTNFHTHHYLHK